MPDAGGGHPFFLFRLPELPAEVIEALRVKRACPASGQAVANVSMENASVSTREFLAGKYVNGPNWNDRLFRAACDLAGRGVPQEEAEPLLLAGAQPWDETNADVARQTITSAFSQSREPARY